MNARLPALVMIVATLALSACSKNEAAASLPHLEDERDAASRATDKAKQRVATLREEAKGLRDDLLAIRAATDESQTQARKAASDQQNLVYEQAQYQNRYLEGVQKRAPGTVLGDIEINTHTYRNARVKSLDPWEVSIIHDNGVTKVAMADLPPNLQARLGFNPNVGAKPTATATAKGAPRSSATTDTDKAASGNAPSLPPPTPVVPMGSLKPGTVLQEGGGLSASGKILHRVVVGEDGRASELVGDGATATSGGTIKGAGSPLPPGYKPIGSGYSGTALDREYQQKKAASKP